MNRFTAMQEEIGISIINLFLLKFLHFLTFRKFIWLEVKIGKVKEDLETVRNRKVF
jgi:hypothetical protein